MPAAALFILGLFLSGCAKAGAGQVLLVDDFSDPKSGFQRHSDADATTDYADGQYKIEVFASQLNVWATNGPKVADAHIELNAHTAGGSNNNLYGAICRHSDNHSFYFFVVSADGYYAIGKVVVDSNGKSKMTLLNSKTYEHSEKIATGSAVNHLVAVCSGNTLSLGVNGAQLAQVTDSDLSMGQVGLYAGTFDEADTDVRFDDLVVTQP